MKNTSEKYFLKGGEADSNVPVILEFWSFKIW